MSLYNFVDRVGPTVSAAWLNQVDVLREAAYTVSAAITLLGDFTFSGSTVFSGALSSTRNGTNAAPNLLLGGNRPTLNLFENDQAANSGQWNFVASIGTFFCQALSDDGATGSTAFSITRSGVNVTAVLFPTTSDGAFVVGDTGVATIVNRLAHFYAPTGAKCAFVTRNDAGANAPTVDTWNAATSTDNLFVRFSTETSLTPRGSISYNRGGGLTAYNTTSDYRAKEVYGPVENSGEVIDGLKVYRGKMLEATVERPMLIAHEVQTVAPYAVTGEKDAVDENGLPKYQQMDASTLIPLLIAEIQLLRSRVAALEGRNNA